MHKIIPDYIECPVSIIIQGAKIRLIPKGYLAHMVGRISAMMPKNATFRSFSALVNKVVLVSACCLKDLRGMKKVDLSANNQ